MDRRVFDMLEHYKRNNGSEEARPVTKEPKDVDFCRETDYSPIQTDILTMAFVNMQPLDSVYETEDGFSRGTIFPNIDKPLSRGNRI